jgi:hypothetical protein
MSMYNPFMPDLSFNRGVAFAVAGGDGLLWANMTDAQKQARRDRKAAEEQAAQTAQGASDNQLAAVTNPEALVTEQDVGYINPSATGTNLASGTGRITGAVPQIDDATKLTTATINPTTVTNNVKDVVNATETVQGEVSADATVDAASMSPEELAQLDLKATQLAEAQKVAVVPPRTIEAGEMISGSAVDMAKVNEALDIQAAVADPTKQATVQGQMEGLMTQFEVLVLPLWQDKL